MVESGFFHCSGCTHIKRNDLKSARLRGQKRDLCVTCVDTIRKRMASKYYGKARSSGPRVHTGLVFIARNFDATLNP